jgi:hypothetical protein
MRIQYCSAAVVALTLAFTAIAIEPCCNVTAVDARTQTVTAKENATGRTFQFKLADAKALATVKVGQVIGADFTSMKVFLQPDAQEPCCNLTNLRAPAPAR